ncbi:MAG: argininosuccinate lyase [Terrimicrobiaceae bacterium]|jgi:argininosuccinate lyase|nr:argininosuccinate lyase [Terrimicrobiaceae bacterium]
MWKGRFKQEASELLKTYTQSVTTDWRLFREDIRGSIAHARALVKAGILTDGEFVRIESGLKAIGSEIAAGTFPFSVELEDVHMNIEAELTRRIGAAGAKLHAARSRNDQVALDFRLYLTGSCAEIGGGIRGLQRALVGLGARHADAVIPGYTHLQRAQPVLFAHHLLAYVEMLDRDCGRISDCAKRMDAMPLGSGAIAGSTLILDREAMAAELGFSRVTTNSMDAVADRDFACELLASLAILGMHVSRLSEDIILWASAEFGFLELSDRHTTGSSLMPQKKNPDIAELARGKTGRLYGNLVALLTTMKSLPLTYNRDMQEDKEGVFDSVDTVLDTLAVFAEMIAAASLREKRALSAASDPLLLATDLADRLVEGGVPFRQAHEIVGKLVARAQESGIPLNHLDPAEFLAASAVLTPEVVERTFDLESALKARRAAGAPSPENVARELARWSAQLG